MRWSDDMELDTFAVLHLIQSLPFFHVMQPTGSSARLPVARRSHKKSRTGCRTCRIRKVKCDELRPLCGNCERHFIGLVSCDFDDRQPVLGHGAPTTQTSQVGRNAEPLDLPPALASGRIDPFNARPQSQTSSRTIDALMGHYLGSFAYRSFPFYASRSLIEAWWPFVRADELLFHVTILLSSIDHSRMSNASISSDVAQLFGQSISLLRARTHESTASTSDATIAAMALLAALEHDRDNMRAVQMHLQALRQIVDIRGGLSAIQEENQMVANLLFWCGLVALNEPSLLPLSYENSMDAIARSEELSDTILLTHDGGEVDLLNIGLDHQTSYVLHEVQRLSRLYTSTLAYNDPEEAMHVLSRLCAIIQRLLILSRGSGAGSEIRGLSQSCRLAGVLHVFAPMSAYFPNPTLMLRSLVAEIKTSLSQMMGNTGSHGHLLLWLLAVAGITAHSMPERTWFVGHLVVLAQDLQIESWESFRSYLVQLAFHDNFCDVSFQALWEEVRRKQETLTL